MAEELSLEKLKIEDTSVDELSLEKLKIEETSVDEPKVEATPVDEPKIEATPVDEPKIEATSVDEPKIEETSVDEPKVEATSVDEPKIEETSVDESKVEKASKKKQKNPEVVANPEFISWKYPPYCELCNVSFSGEPCSKLHFEGKSHKNCLHTWRKYQNPDEITKSKNVLCNICWKEMNTQLILDTHCTSPAHLKAEEGRLIVQRLKEEYRQLKELHQTK